MLWVIRLATVALVAVPALSGVINMTPAGDIKHRSLENYVAVRSLSIRTPEVTPPNTDPNWKNVVLTIMNDARKKHGASALKWLNAAGTLALTNANKCKLRHSVG